MYKLTNISYSKTTQKISSSLSNLFEDDSTQEYKHSQDSYITIYVPQHRYNLRTLPNRRLSTDTSTHNFSALCSSSATRLLRQHAQPQSSEIPSSELASRSYFTSGTDTASLISSDVQTAYLSGNLFSEVLVPTPVQPTVRLPEYFTTDNSRPPTPNFADYPLRIDGITTSITMEPQKNLNIIKLLLQFITLINCILVLSPTCQHIKTGFMAQRTILYTIVQHITNLK